MKMLYFILLFLPFSFFWSGKEKVVSSEKVEVQEMAFTLECDTRNCFNEGPSLVAYLSADLGTKPYTFVWDINGSIVRTIEKEETFDVLNISNININDYSVTITDSKPTGAKKTDDCGSITITLPSAPTEFTINVDSIQPCPDQSNGSITINPMGNSSYDYNFLWEDESDDSGRDMLAEGLYYVTVTETNSTCTTTRTIDLDPAFIQISQTKKVNPKCFGVANGELMVEASGGTISSGEDYEYEWGDGTTTSARADLAAGIYFVTATDSNGCTASANFFLENPPEFEITQITTTPQTYTAGTDGTITVSTINGTGPYRYIVKDDSGNIIKNVLDPNTTKTLSGFSQGNYTIFVQDNATGCQPSSPAFVPQSKFIGFSPNPICRENPITFEIENLIPNQTYRVKFPNSLVQDIDFASGVYSSEIPPTATSGDIEICFNASCSRKVKLDNSYIQIGEDEVLGIVGHESVYCNNDEAFTLTGYPAGGTWGVTYDPAQSSNNAFNTTTGEFNPSTVFDFDSEPSIMVGITYISPSDCGNFTTVNFVINPIPNFTSINYNGPDLEANSSAIDLTTELTFNPSFQSGGVFSGTGVIGNTFDPSNLPNGTYPITYTLTLGDCSVSHSTDIKIVEEETISGLNGTGKYCEDSPTSTVPSGITGNEVLTNLSTSPAIYFSSHFTEISSSPLQYRFDPSFNNNQNTTEIFTVSATFKDNNTGSSKLVTQDITIYPKPATPSIDTDPEYCFSPGFSFPLEGTPAGGIFRVDGNPPTSSTPPGDYILEYTVTENSICSSMTTAMVTVHPDLSPTIDNLGKTYCLYPNQSIPLMGSPSPGTFQIETPSGQIISNIDSLKPTEPGKHIITYSYAYIYPATQCTKSVSQDVEIFSLPSLQINDLDSTYCIDSDLVINFNVSPTSGEIEVTDSNGGVVSTTNSFAPTIDGKYTITYTYTDANMCTNYIVESTIVHPLPDPEFIDLESQYCLYPDLRIDLIAKPEGGDFKVIDVSGSLINITANFYSPPEDGEYTIQYIVTDENGCGNSIDSLITINPLPQPTITGLEEEYCISATDNIYLTGSSAQSSYFNVLTPESILLENVTSFIPEIADDYIVNYYVTDVNGCDNSTAQTVQINDLPDPQFIDLLDQYCLYPNMIIEFDVSLTPNNIEITDPDMQPISVTNPNPNSFSFSPTIKGDYLVTYSHTDNNDCTNTITQIVKLLKLPEPEFNNLKSEYCFYPNLSIFLSGTPNANPSVPTTSEFNIIPPNNLPTVMIPNNSNYSPPEAGNYVITFTHTDDNTCTNSISKTVTILQLPEPTIDSLENEYCHTLDSILLKGSIAKDSFFTLRNPYNQITQNATSFTPSYINPNQNPNLYTITYTVTDDKGCINATDTIITVYPLPVPEITGLDNQYCIDPTLEVVMTGSHPNPSYFYTLYPDGTSTNDTIFTPNQVGIYEVNYYATDINGCQDSIKRYVTVDSLPIFEIASLERTYCTNNGIDTWTGSQQSINDKFILYSAIVDADGNCLPQDSIMEGTSFDVGEYPSPGEYVMEYTYTNINGCINSTLQCVTIFAPPVADFVLDVSCTETTINFTNTSTVPEYDSIINVNWLFQGTILNDTLYSDSLSDAIAYFLTLEVTTELGCTDDTSKTFNIGANPKFDYDLNVAIEDKPIPFNIKSIGSNFGLTLPFDSVVNVRYDFGDGTLVDTLLYELQHSYDNPGVYETSIEIQTSRGCSRIINKLAYVVPYITDFPYCSNFDSIPWYAHSRNQSDNLWQLSTTNFSNDIGNIWAIHSDENTLGYQANADGWVYGPSFDLSDMTRPYLSIDVFYDNVSLNDGMIVEISNNGKIWERLGEPEEGLNWYENEDLFATPGDYENYTSTGKPFGWTGNSNGWKTARYKLDEHRNKTNLRVRVAFETISNSPSNTAIAAFHNVCVKERNQNILFEHFTNLNENSAQGIDEMLYENCLEYDYNNFTTNPLDIIFTQYHTAEPEKDLIYNSNSGDMNARASRYGISQPLLIEINGKEINSGSSSDWEQNQIDLLLLADPIFDIQMATPVINNGVINVSATVTAQKAHTFPENLDLYFLIIEDKVNTSGRILRNVVRKILPTTGITVPSTWVENQSVSHTQTWSDLSTINNQSNLFAVAFLQNRETDEIYQSASSQVVEPPVPTAIDQVPSSKQSITLYPNPTSQQVQVSFNAPHNQTFEWELFDAVGKRVAVGKERKGSQQFDIATQDFTNGTYFLVLYSENATVVLQEKLIIIH